MLWNTPGWPGWGQGDDTPTKGLVGGHNVFAQPTDEAGVGSQYPAFFIFFVPACEGLQSRGTLCPELLLAWW